MKFLYIQDTHIKGKNPQSRLGNYYQDVMAKIKEVIEIAKKKEVDEIIHGGDVYEAPLVSNTILDELVDLIEESEIRWNILWGNHDEIGHNPKLSKASTLAHIFRRSKLIKHCNLHIDSSNNYVIQPFDYYHNIEEDIKNNGLTCSRPNAKLKIGIVHAFITLTPFLPQVMHVVAKDIKTDFDIILVAHYHQAWGVKEINGTKFINIGCLGRTGIDEVDIKPQALLIDTNTKEIEFISLKIAKPGKEVFNVEKIAEQKKYEKNIDDFINSLKGTKFQSLNIKGIIEQIAKQKKIDREIVDCVIERIGGFE